MRARETRAGRRPAFLLIAALCGSLVTYAFLKFHQTKEDPSAGHPHLLGGSFKTDARRLAIVIPYRGRQSQLEVMLPITADCIRRSQAGQTISDAESKHLKK